MKSYHFYADGAWHEPASGRWIESEDPADGTVWARVPDCDEADIALAVLAAKTAFDEGPWGRMTASGRGRLLTRIGDVLVASAARLGAVETRDNGKLPAHITPALRTWLADSFHYYAGMCDKFEGSLIPADAPNVLNYQRWQPFGVVALITAWNSPLGVLIWKLAPALAAGNAVVIKPSEHASCSTLELMAVLEEADLPKGVVNVVTGYGPTTGEPLVAHPDVRMVSFTGGVAGGRAVAAAAAGQVKPLVMELGGKSPQIVLPDASLDLAVRGVAAGIFPVSGQSCIAGSRLLLHRSLADDFSQRLVEVAKKARIGRPDDPATQVGPIANAPHYARILERIAAAEAAGHRLLLDGRGARRDSGYYIGPTIFAEVSSEDELARSEVFGPVVSIEIWEDEAEVVRIANDSIYGLAAGIWTSDVNKAIRLADRIEAGTVYINNYFNAAAQSPVGGFKQSGYGRENGWEGMRCFLQTKSVWLDTDPDQPDPFPA